MRSNNLRKNIRPFYLRIQRSNHRFFHRLHPFGILLKCFCHGFHIHTNFRKIHRFQYLPVIRRQRRGSSKPTTDGHHLFIVRLQLGSDLRTLHQAFFYGTIGIQCSRRRGTGQLPVNSLSCSVKPGLLFFLVTFTQQTGSRHAQARKIDIYRHLFVGHKKQLQNRFVQPQCRQSWLQQLCFQMKRAILTDFNTLLPFLRKKAVFIFQFRKQ